MSRESALRTTLQLPDDLSLRVISVSPSGDCFYECINELLNEKESNYVTSDLPLVTGLKVRSTEDDNSPAITPQEMRDHVADQLSSEQFGLYKMFASGMDVAAEFSTIT